MSTIIHDYSSEATSPPAPPIRVTATGVDLDPAIVVGLAINAALAMPNVPEPVMRALQDHAKAGSWAARTTLEWVDRRTRDWPAVLPERLPGQGEGS